MLQQDLFIFCSKVYATGWQVTLATHPFRGRLRTLTNSEGKRLVFATERLIYLTAKDIDGDSQKPSPSFPEGEYTENTQFN